MRTPIFLMALAAACVDPDVGRDRDNDGFQNWELGGDDCDDTNAAVNPSASEACGNGIDDDCDGFIDDEGIGQVVWYIDQDEDGFPSPEPYEGCSPPDGSFADLTRGVDCNDDEARSFPGNPETYYDGIDGDCLEGNDFDADGDGYTSAEHGGDDCDDNALDVNPGSVEVCNNGIDDDCDGGPGPCEYRGQYALADVTESAAPYTPLDLVLSDLDADGVDEVVAVVAVGQGFELFALSIADLARGQAASQEVSLPSSIAGFVPRLHVAGDYNADGVLDPVVWDEDGVAVWLSDDNGRRLQVFPAGEAGAITHVSAFREERVADQLAVFTTQGFAGTEPASHLLNVAAFLVTTPLLEADAAVSPSGVVAGGPAVLQENTPTILAEFVRGNSLLSVLEGGAIYGPFPDLFRSAGSFIPLDAPNASLILPWAEVIPISPTEQLWYSPMVLPYYPSISGGDVSFAARVLLDGGDVSFTAVPTRYALADREADDDGVVASTMCFADVDRDGGTDWVRAVGWGNSDVPPDEYDVEVVRNVLDADEDSPPTATIQLGTQVGRLWCDPSWDYIFGSTDRTLFAIPTRGL